MGKSPMEGDDDGMRSKTETATDAERSEAIARHQLAAIREVKKLESRYNSGNIKQIPERDDSKRKDGDYTVRSTATHVIKVKDETTQIKQRVFQLIAGGGSGAITKTATAPLERVKILLQLQGMKGNARHPKYRGVLGTMRQVVREEGFLSLYKGNGANVLRVVPVYSLKFMFNDAFRDIVKKGDEPLSFTGLILSGTMAGLFQTCVTYPLETVRTRLTLGIGLGVKYNGIIDVFRTTVRTEGVAGLYKGLGPTILTGSPYVGLQMSFYELFKRNSPEEVENYVLAQQLYKLSCGAFAGLIAQTITYPGDTVRRRMQTNGMNGEPKVYKNSFDCTMKMIRNEGTQSLFSGITANLVRCLPGAAIQFWAYDMLKSLLNV